MVNTPRFRRNSGVTPGPNAQSPARPPVAGTTPGSTARLPQLDSLRGLAALTVVFHHALLILPVMAVVGHGWSDPLYVALLKYTPLHALFDGGSAVLLFFVLSGFVLSLPYHSGRQDAYWVFILRRICRIWIPYIAVVLAAIVVRAALASHGVTEGLSTWYRHIWTSSASPGVIVRHAALIPKFNDDAFDPAVWSLVHEMRLSLVFPLVMVAVCRLRWQFTTAAAVCVASLAFLLDRRAGTTAPDANTSYYLTGEYLLMFVIGAILARHHRHLIAWMTRRSLLEKSVWLATAITLYCSGWLILGFHHSALQPLSDWTAMTGASMLIVMAIGSGRGTALLLKRPLLFLGRVSYSLYLVHAVVIIATLHLLSGHVPLPFTLLLGVAASLLFAAAVHHWVERPSIQLGRHIHRSAAHHRRALEARAKQDVA